MIGLNSMNRGFAGANHRGGYTHFDSRICFQAHDDYYNCIDKINENLNKFMCMNELYAYETYCPVDFIRTRKFIYIQEKRDMMIWNQDELDLINIKKNYIGMENSPDYKLFDSPLLKNIHKT